MFTKYYLITFVVLAAVAGIGLFATVGATPGSSALRLTDGGQGWHDRGESFVSPTKKPSGDQEGIINVALPDKSVVTDGLILHEDFEDGTFDDTAHCANMKTCDGSSSVSSEMAHHGTYALRTEVNPFHDRAKGKENKSRGGRAEITFNNKNNSFNVFDGHTYWLSFSFNIVKPWEGGGENSRATIFDIHGIGKVGGGVPLAIAYRDGRLLAASSQLQKTGDMAMAFGSKEERRKMADLGAITFAQSAPIRQGEWNDVVIRYKLSSEPDGSIEVWLNGEKFADVSGVVTYDTKNNPKRGYYIKVGIYAPQFRSDAKSSKRLCGEASLAGCVDQSMVIYHDDIKMYDAASGVTYDDVAP